MNSNLKVLIVEDNPCDVELIHYFLESAGYNVTYQVVTLQSAFLEHILLDYDVIIADNELPRFSAVEAIQCLSSIQCKIPLIIVSGSIREELAVECLRLGASDYLLKDRLARLGSAVKRAIENARLLQQSKESDRQLRLREELYRTMVESVSDYAFASLDTNGFITMWNSGAERIFGFESSEIIGRYFGILYSEVNEENGVPLQQLKQTEKQERFQCQELRRKKDGSFFIARISMAPMLTLDGDLLGFSMVARDVTDQVNYERERTKILEMEVAARLKADEARKEAELTNKLKDEFIGNISHELRTPLGVIIGWGDLLKEKSLSENESRDAIDIIQRNGQALLQIVDDLMDVSRIITGKNTIQAQKVDLESLVTDVMSSLSVMMAAKKATVNLQNELEKRVTLFVDPHRMRQVFTNILNNALKFCKDIAEVNIRLYLSGRRVRVEFKDNGIGISPEFMPYIFERFRQADGSKSRSHGGLGIGLAVVKHFVELHGGRVLVESAGLNQGSCFTVEIPEVRIVEEEEPSALLNERVNKARALDGLEILVVEDDESTNQLICRVLSGAGAKVASVNSGVEAITRLETESVDSIVCDIGMAGMDGFEVIQKIRKEIPEVNRSVPVLALTAYCSQSDQKRVFESGFNEFMSKPMRSAELVSTVKRMVERHRHNEKGM